MRSSLASVVTFVSMFCLLAPASADEIYLLADFNDKTIDAPIGTGGPAVGEPVGVEMSPAGAVVRAVPMPTPCLQIVDESDCCAQSVRFEFLDDAEIAAGPVVIRLDLWIPAQESSRFSLGVRERGGAADDFATVWLAFGTVSVTDEDDHPGPVGAYATDQVLSVRLAFDMTAGTYDLSVGGVPLLDDESHGVVGSAVGALLLSYVNDDEVGDAYYIDQIYVGEGDPAPAEPTTWGSVKTQFLGTE